MDYYSFADPKGMEGWVGLVGWSISDSLPTKWSPINRKSGAGQGKSDSQRPTCYPLSYAASQTCCSMWRQLLCVRHEATIWLK